MLDSAPATARATFRTVFAEARAHVRFSVVTTPNPSTGDNRLTGVTAASSDETWAVGNYLDTPSGNQLTLIERGGERGAWMQVASPNPSADGSNQLSSVTSVAPNEQWAVGGFDGADASQTPSCSTRTITGKSKAWSRT